MQEQLVVVTPLTHIIHEIDDEVIIVRGVVILDLL
jgi:hypothetical protein